MDVSVSYRLKSGQKAILMPNATLHRAIPLCDALDAALRIAERNCIRVNRELFAQYVAYKVGNLISKQTTVTLRTIGGWVDCYESFFNPHGD